MPTDPITFSLDAPIVSTSVILQDNAPESDDDIAAKKRRISKPRKPLFHETNLQFHQFTEEEVHTTFLCCVVTLFQDARLADALQHHLASHVPEDQLPWDTIAASLGAPTITPDDCKHRWSVMRAKKTTHNPYSLTVRQTLSGMSHLHFTGTNSTQCRGTAH